jgi:hypothetical protein
MHSKQRLKTWHKVKSTPRYSTLTTRQKATRQRSLNLLSDLRARKDSYGRLLRKHHLDTRTAHQYLGRNLIGGTRGQRVRATKSDRLVREMLFPTKFGDQPVLTRNSKDATKLSEYFHDRGNLLRGKVGVNEFETKWRAGRVAGHELFADASGIFHMANAGILKLENLYASTGSAR